MDRVYKKNVISGKNLEALLLMAEIRLTSWYGKYPIIYDGFYAS